MTQDSALVLFGTHPVIHGGCGGEVFMVRGIASSSRLLCFGCLAESGDDGFYADPTPEVQEIIMKATAYWTGAR